MCALVELVRQAPTPPHPRWPDGLVPPFLVLLGGLPLRACHWVVLSVFLFAQVYLNGHFLGSKDFGYTNSR